MSRRAGGAEGEAPLVYGVHPVEELLERRLDEVDRLFVARESGSGLGRILRAARGAGIPITHLPRRVLDRKVGGRASHQGIAAQVAAFPYAAADELCAAAAARELGLLLLLDGVQDAGNLGAIVRAAAAAGADGLLLASDGTVGLTPGVAKASAGAVERLPVAREPRPPARIRELRELGFSTVLLDPRGGRAWHEAELTGRVLLVAGGEPGGVRKRVAGECDFCVSIPLEAGVESLNVAIAVSVLLFETVRQRQGCA